MKPVAFMCPTGLEYKQRATDFMYNDALYDKKLNWIPLYTHPVKELTDEEIIEIAKECKAPWHSHAIDPMMFARAILRKAQEK